MVQIKYKGCEIVPTDEYFSVFPDFVSEQGLSKVKSLMGFLRKGNSKDWLSPFDRWIHSEFFSQFPYTKRHFSVKLIDDLLSSCYLYNNDADFKKFEDNYRSMVGTNSVILPFHLRDKSVIQFFNRSETTFSYDPEIFNLAYNDLVSLIQFNELYPLSYSDVLDLTEKSTQFGLPYMLHGNEEIDSQPSYLKYLSLSLKDWEQNSITQMPAVMSTRTQSSGTDFPKQRLVWMVPHSVIFTELKFMHPITEILSASPHFCERVSSDKTDEYIDLIFSDSDKTETELIGFDVSSFDASVPTLLIETVFSAVKYWYGNNFDDILQSICDHMCKCDLVTPVGVFINRDGGVDSGSGFTNLVDSLVHFLLFRYTVIKLNKQDSINHVTINGDDGVWLVQGLTPNILSDIVSEFGMVCNSEKVSFSFRSVTFCQRLYIKGYIIDGHHRGIRSSYRTISSIINYERRRKASWNLLCDSVRVVSQLHEMRYNPIHYQLTLALVRSDPNGLGVKYPSGIHGIFKDSGGFEKVVELSYSSSYEREKAVARSKNMFSMKTIRILQALYISTIKQS